MFISLLAATFVVALLVSVIVSYAFNKPLDRILLRIIADDIAEGWHKYLRFAIIVVGVSSGVRLYQLERYIVPDKVIPGAETVPEALELTSERWVLEIYRTIIESLTGIAWMLLVFFIFALIAFVIVKQGELRKTRSES
jgi:hypothetical protein